MVVVKALKKKLKLNTVDWPLHNGRPRRETEESGRCGKVQLYFIVCLFFFFQEVQHVYCAKFVLTTVAFKSGAPNDRGIFPNKSEMSKMVLSMLQKPVWLIWSCPKNYPSVRMFKGNFGRLETFSCPTVLVETARTRRNHAFIKKF